MPRLAPVIKTIFPAICMMSSNERSPRIRDGSPGVLGAGALRLETAVGLDQATLAVHVPRPRPIGERSVGAVLVAPLRHHVQEAVDAQELLPAAAIGRVGVEHLTGL